MHLPPGVMTHLSAEALECCWPRKNDPALLALRHDQAGQVGQPIVLDGLWQQPRREFRSRACSKRTKPQPVLQFSGMAPAVPFRGERLVDGAGKDAGLFSHEGEKRSGWPFTGAEWAARVAQVAEHDCVAEAVMIAAAAPDCCRSASASV